MGETHTIKTEDVMAHITNTQKVAGGYYWNAKNLEVEVISEEGGHLKGGDYVKVPFVALFAIVPLLGATFLMSLPVIGFGLVAYAAAKKATRLVTSGATDLAATVQPGQFAAGAAYFTGKAGEEKKEGTAEGEKAPGLEAVEKEIAARKEKK